MHGRTFIKGMIMNNNTILHHVGLCLCAVSVLSLTACGSKPTKSEIQKPVETHHVKQQTKNLPVAYKPVKPVNVIKTKQPRVIVKKRVAENGLSREQYNNKYKADKLRNQQKYLAKYKAEQLRKKYQARNSTAQARNDVHLNYKASSTRHIKYASLQGDYAGNPQAAAFINKMSSKYGFDRGYLNYLFSNTKATPFLKRMAYADAFGRRSTGKKPRPGRWTRYRGNFLTERTISKGIQFYRQNRVALQRAEQRYGVPKEYILGIIGVETRYGGNVGKNRAIDALAAMGFNNPRRGKYFRSELESYLLMTRSERLDPLKPMASYAGALGLSQFMPSNIKRYGVDFDRSGSINLWTPQDAIGSVANYFKKHGWRNGGTVAVPAKYNSSGYRTLRTGFKSKHSLTRLKNMGVSANNLGNISGKVSLIKLNTYEGDELWIGGHNFYVITRYNHSSRYAMAVHQLAQAIKGRIGGRGVIRQASKEYPKNAELALLDKKIF